MKLLALTLVLGTCHAYHSELWTREQEDAAGIRRNHVKSPLPQDTVQTSDLPDSFTWGDKDGVNYLTPSLNQHIPQYCGSCWAHGTSSALADRVKIARGAKGADVQISIQHILNCGNAGSCHGGSPAGVYDWINSISEKTGTGVGFETNQPYMACSSESREGWCAKASNEWKCEPINVARTCGTFGIPCVALDRYPNVTVSEFGTIRNDYVAMQKEIFARGPIAALIDATPIHNYTSGIAGGPPGGTNHIISIVGWGQGGHSKTGKYWIVRNSWGEYWGEMGYIRVEMGENAFGIEDMGYWAVPGAFTTADDQTHCFEGGQNCEAAQ